ncbi:hypothetical protein C8N24_3992 [Solirubrobacter pauli]|uniref:Uncharacterized protein n=1 Tax=Solirubrobacter pauli TaxID=166793 RepID=A0A660KYG1_9ACTN|nr:hypothetical protein [Solirubrobacter pauli]RKQ85984.1 hypothetical protein C8N24_3992 [Solirubrobacter pauli]
MTSIIVQALLLRALDTLPTDLRARYEQEWRADLAELSGMARLSWALGLTRASRRLRAPHQRALARTLLPVFALDAITLAVAYFAAFALRFGGDLPSRYSDLFAQTLPAAIAGGLIAVAAVRGRAVSGALLATLIVIAYVALVQPVLVNSFEGLRPLNLPASVCLIFALLAGVGMTITRAGLALLRTAAQQTH